MSMQGNSVQKEVNDAKAPPTKKSKMAVKEQKVEVFDYEKAKFTDFLEGNVICPFAVFNEMSHCCA